MKNLIGCLVLMTGALILSATGQVAESRTKPLQVGSVAPDFSLTSTDGKVVALSSIKRPTVLVFFRGYWCPFCVRQLSDLRTLLPEGSKASLLAISVDSPATSGTLALKIAKDGKGAINYPILSDPEHRTIDAFGIYDPTYAGQGFDGIPRPSVFILDKDRRIVWAKIESDYRKRPSNDDIRAELKKLE